MCNYYSHALWHNSAVLWNSLLFCLFQGNSITRGNHTFEPAPSYFKSNHYFAWIAKVACLCLMQHSSHAFPSNTISLLPQDAQDLHSPKHSQLSNLKVNWETFVAEKNWNYKVVKYPFSWRKLNIMDISDFYSIIHTHIHVNIQVSKENVRNNWLCTIAQFSNIFQDGGIMHCPGCWWTFLQSRHHSGWWSWCPLCCNIFFPSMFWLHMTAVSSDLLPI